jgi:hypothetical protein
MSPRLLLVASLALAAAPVAAQPPAPQPAEERSGGLEGEVIGYLALPVLLVLVVAIGFLIGGEDEDMPASP